MESGQNIKNSENKNKKQENSISVVIPAKNEAGSIAAVVNSSMRHADEVIVIDGRSDDGTGGIAAECGARVIKDNGLGKGDAIRIGLKEASGRAVVLLDADGSHNTDDIRKLAAPILADNADLVIGSRLLGGSDEIHGNFTNYIRMVGAGFITLMINLRWKTELTDVENGFRSIDKNVAQRLELKAVDFDIEQEMVIKALKKGFRVTEAASHEFKRSSGYSKLPTWKGIKFLWRLFMEMIKK